MKCAKLAVTVVALVTLSGCEWPEIRPRYELITATDGKIYRLDNKSGAVHYVTSESLVHLSEEKPTLRVGEYYRMSDAKDDTKFLKYVGNGQFEKSQWAVRKLP
jgi:hypothetical protein